MKKIFTIFTVVFLSSFSSASALTKPGPEANIDNLSYIFYLYYDQGQLFGDRDYDVKFDVIEEAYAEQSVPEGIGYKAVITNANSAVIKTFFFDPKIQNPALTAGKISVKGPYAPNGQKVTFYNAQNQELVSIFVVGASICNDDGTCNEAAGENDRTCSNDCKKPRPTPVPAPIGGSSEIGFLDSLGFDLNSILIIVVSVLGVGVVGWLVWKRWKKHRESAFTPEITAPLPPSPSLPTPEQMDQQGQNLN